MEKDKSSGRSKSHASRACTTCRRSRTRCLPGSKPNGACARCEAKGSDCQWETGPDRRRNRADTQAHVEQLQTRIAELEAQLLLMSTHSCSAIGPTPVPTSVEDEGDELPIPPPLPLTVGGESMSMRAPTVDSSPSAGTPATSASASTSTSTTTPPSVTGQLQSDETGELHWHTETTVFDPTISNRLPQQKKASTLAFLPVPLDNKLHVELIELAFAYHFSVFRVLERSEVDISSERKTTYSPFVHLAVLATGSRYLHNAPPELYGNPSDPATRGEPFVDAALELLVDELSSPKLSTIIGLVILASYVGGVNAPRAGWLYAGLACRLCIDFGLHIDPLPTENIDPSLRLLRRRLFWLCFSHDVSWAVCLGRRSAFQLSDIHQPPLRYEAAGGAGGQSLPGDGAAWPFEIRLNVLAWKIVELNYTDEGKTLDGSERAERVREVWRELGEFHESLPSIYRGPGMFLKSPDTLQLNLHYHMLIILLLKPFYASLQSCQGADIDPSIHQLALEQCSAAPLAIIDLAERYEAAGLPVSLSAKNTYLALLHAGAMSIQIANSLLSSSTSVSSLLADPNSAFHHRLRTTEAAIRLLTETAKSWESSKQSMMVLGRLRAGLLERAKEAQDKEDGLKASEAVSAPVLSVAPMQAVSAPPTSSANFSLPTLPSLVAPASAAFPLPTPPAALPEPTPIIPLPDSTAAYAPTYPAFDLNFDLNFGGVDFDIMSMNGGGAVFGGVGGVPLEQYLNSGWTVNNYLASVPSYLGGL
ncbi:hypothetical protein JCM11251_003959 [Rhodosporidiobolus azoricus]